MTKLNVGDHVIGSLTNIKAMRKRLKEKGLTLKSGRAIGVWKIKKDKSLGPRQRVYVVTKLKRKK